MLNHSKYNRDIAQVLQQRGKPRGGFEFVFLCEILGDFKLFPWCCKKLIQEEQKTSLPDASNFLEC